MCFVPPPSQTIQDLGMLYLATPLHLCDTITHSFVSHLCFQFFAVTTMMLGVSVHSSYCACAEFLQDVHRSETVGYRVVDFQHTK